jgi:hypothetical protein
LKTRLVVGLLILAACGDPEDGGGPDDPPGAGSGSEDSGVPDGGGAGSGGSGGGGSGGTGSGATCATVECDPNAVCSEEGGDATCVCNDGFTGDGETCTDVDECETDDGGCDGDAVCVNQQGGFRCLCNEGLTGDGESCSPIQVDECGDADLNTCDPNAECDDTASGFECECPDGYDGDGKSCADVDECDEGDDDCVADATCTNTFGGFTCECSPGFEGDGQDECESICEGACTGNALCRVVGQQVPDNPPDDQPADTETIAVCSTTICEPGFIDNGASCVAVTGGDNCGLCDAAGSDDVDGAVCTGTAGSGACTCAPGYEDPDGGALNCVDIDECATGNGDCGDDETNRCVNLTGGHACDCQEGYERDGQGTCVDVNECNLSPGPCHPNATCDNDDGGFDCECNDGFDGDGFVCADIDECEEEDDDCLDDDVARCINTNGDFQCQCRRGYEGDGVDDCENLDECENASDNDCADEATCTDTTPEENPFGYVCSCGEGQSGDGTECSDLNECNNASLFDCPPNSQCKNTEGAYECECGGQFAGDDADSCYCDLSGFWAMRQDLDICWCDQDLLDVTIIGAGAAEASIWELHKYTYDGERIVVEKKGCGEDNEPDLVSPLFEGELDDLPETYSSYIPRSVYDDFDLQPGKTIPEAGIVPGTMFTTPDEAAVVGIDLGDDPEGADWPTSSASVDEDDWVDSDGDGQPGFTIWSRRPSERTEAYTSDYQDYFDYPPVDLWASNGPSPYTHLAGDISERTACQSVATRVITKLDADVDDCEHITGNVINVRTDGRVHSCLKVPYTDWDEDIDCDADAWDEAAASSEPDDDFTALCDASEIERLDDTDQSQTSQATFELVKIGGLDDDIDCDDVRAALPAISRANPTPIACSCP